VAERWQPSLTWEERLKLLVPPRLYVRYKAAREWRRGEPEFRLLPLLSDRQRNAVDAGANKGTFTYEMSRRARHVFAFEPNPKMFAVLRRTAGRNVTVFDMALSNTSGTAELRIPRYGKGSFSNQGASLSTVKVSDDYASVSVSAKRLDDFGLADIGFLKIDVEGFEQEVIDGARAVIARDRPTLLIELEEKHTRIPIERSLAAVESLGYRGMFLERASGALKDLGHFDPERHHRSRELGYVFNFVFFPTAGR
jgi:FkbM family methyltransferase